MANYLVERRAPQQRTRCCLRGFLDWRLVPPTEVVAMIYELRVYQPVPGQMPKLLARFRDKVLPIWEGHGIRPIGFWTTLVGESSNELTYMLPWSVQRHGNTVHFRAKSVMPFPIFANQKHSANH